jgi:hypothetical protein
VEYINALCRRETMGAGDAVIESVRNFFNNTLKKALAEEGLTPKYRS